MVHIPFPPFDAVMNICLVYMSFLFLAGGGIPANSLLCGFGYVQYMLAEA